MQLSTKLLILSIIVLIIVTFSSQQQIPLGNDAIHLSQIQSLTLHRDRFTTGKRTRPLPQLQCTHKQDSYEPETVQCINKGTDGKTYNWNCEASLREGYKFGKLNINCEGYRFPGDDYVLKGSCSLEYTLEKTKVPHNQQPNHQRNHQTPHYKHEPISSNPSSLGSFTIVIIILAIIGCIWLSKQKSPSRVQEPRTNPSMYPDVNPNYNPNLHETSTHPSSWSDSNSSIPTFLAGAAAGYAGSTLYNSQRNSENNGSYFESSSYGNNYSNYENEYYPTHSYQSSNDDNSKEHTVSGYAETSSR